MQGNESGRPREIELVARYLTGPLAFSHTYMNDYCIGLSVPIRNASRSNGASMLL